MDQIAIIAPGSMGSGLARLFTEHRIKVLTCLDGRSDASVARARSVGMTPSSLEEIGLCPIILSVVPPSEALQQACYLAPAISAGKRAPLYLDLNATSPETSKLIGANITKAGGRYVDGCILGNPPTAGRVGPSVYVCGPYADDTLSLTEAGLNVKIIEGPIGAASGLKMTFAGIMKGLTALGSGMMLAATNAGAEAALLHELRSGQPDLARWFDRQIPRMYAKTYRWVGEMQEISTFLGPDQPLAAAFESFSDFFKELKGEYGGESRTEVLQRIYPLTQEQAEI